ncbi:hypothetical protein [Flavobacterium ginsengiterrae]|uniref:Uncharacterized protein n=1 Tax=Flavobacterium ginsengiterrae TaxID=871695 RepID=A0ABP7GIG4_9FLAO
MESEELRALENIKKLSFRYLNILKPTANNIYNAEIKMSSYSELGCVILNMLKLCILALEYDDCDKPSIDLRLILEKTVELFPVDEFELLDVVNELFVEK